MSNGNKNPLRGARLTYYIFEGVLIGQAGGRPFHLFAHSGGGGGSKIKSVPLPEVVNNPYMTTLRVKSERTPAEVAASEGLGERGGPIPLGRYIICSPSRTAKERPWFKAKPAAFLEPDNKTMKRRGFYIHGQGVHGSDGCIVPLSDFKDLMDAIERDGGGVLYVEEAMGGDRFA